MLIDNNQEFLNAYNRLDNYLKNSTGVHSHKNLISYLEVILPERKRSELKTIREYKNTIESHGVNPGAMKPIVPRSWIVWLEDELQYCKNHKIEVTKKLRRVLNLDNCKHNNSRSNDKNRKKIETIKYGLTNQSDTITEMMIEEAISLHNFEKAIKKGGIHAELLNAMIQKLEKEYTNDELRSYLIECGSQKNILDRKGLLKEVAELMIAQTDRGQLIKMLGLNS